MMQNYDVKKTNAEMKLCFSVATATCDNLDKLNATTVFTCHHRHYTLYKTVTAKYVTSFYITFFN